MASEKLKPICIFTYTLESNTTINILFPYDIEENVPGVPLLWIFLDCYKSVDFRHFLRKT